MSVIDEELEPTSLGSQVAGHLAQPADRGAQPGGPAAPGRPTPSRRTRRPAGPSPRDRLGGDRRLRADHLPRPRVAGGGRRVRAAASTWWSPTCPGPQFPLYAAGARMLETYPVHAAAARARAGDRRHVVRRRRATTASPPTGTRCPTSTCSASASREALDELVGQRLARARQRAPRGRKKRAAKPVARDPARLRCPARLDDLRAALLADGTGPAPSPRTPSPTRSVELADGGEEELGVRRARGGRAARTACRPARRRVGSCSRSTCRRPCGRRGRAGAGDEVAARRSRRCCGLRRRGAAVAAAGRRPGRLRGRRPADRASLTTSSAWCATQEIPALLQIADPR